MAPRSHALYTHVARAAALALLPLLGACSGGESRAPEPASGPVAEAPVTQEAPATTKGTVGVISGEVPSDDDRFVLTVDVPNEAAVGEQGKVTVRVEPSGPWHMNLDYPTSLEMKPVEGVALAKAKQKKVDAVKLDDDSCEFEVAFTPEAAGDRSFAGEFKFAVCQDDACAPVTKDIAFQVAVK